MTPCALCGQLRISEEDAATVRHQTGERNPVLVCDMCELPLRDACERAVREYFTRRRSTEYCRRRCCGTEEDRHRISCVSNYTDMVNTFNYHMGLLDRRRRSNFILRGMAQ